MTEPTLTAPAPSEIEVSIFGRGYGEAIAIHVGDGRWLAIDSIAESKKSVTLLYLKELGVDVANKLEVIVATHWHDDHVRGLAHLFTAAERAEIIVPLAMLDKEFIKFAASFSNQNSAKFSTGVEEFGKILALAKKRNIAGTRYPLRLAEHGYVGYRQPAGKLTHGAAVTLEALSPSHFDVAAFVTRISAVSPQPQVLQRTPHYGANDVSAAFWLQLGGDAILLGADVENSGHPDSGWNAILSDSVQPLSKASLVKVPHHGGLSGHHDDMWTQLLEPAPVASLTPWSKGGKKLPVDVDVTRITALAGSSFSTGPSPFGKSTDQPHMVAKTLRADALKLHKLGNKVGHIRHRATVEAGQLTWHTDLFGQACRLSAMAA